MCTLIYSFHYFLLVIREEKERGRVDEGNVNRKTERKIKEWSEMQRKKEK